jgi:CubicO group peptidase (beta-lactamase class C family)
LLARGGEVAYCKSFGFRDRTAAATLQRSDIFRIASMTKPITSVAIMMLAERGQIFIAEPVSKTLPEFAGLKVGEEQTDSAGRKSLRLVEAERAMTVQDLLRHTAGLTYGFAGRSLVKTAYNEAGLFNMAHTNAEMVTLLSKLPLAHQPGKVWDYSMATDVLGRIVEVVSGKTLDQFFEDEIFTPLGMVDTAFLLPEEKADRMAQPLPDSKTLLQTGMLDHTVAYPWFSGGAGLYSTADDYLKFCQFLRQRGEFGGKRLLAPGTIDLMTSDHLPPGIAYDPFTPVLFEAEAPTPDMGQSFGLGLAVRTHPGMNPMSGSVGDYYWAGALGTYFWIDPKEDLIAIFMSQAPEHRLHYRYVMRQLVYQALEG